MVRVGVLRAQPAFGWEAVITPVVDHALGLEEVDPDRIALLGLSQAGYWVPRAVAFERRIAAAIVDPGVWDVSASWYSHISGGMKRLAAGAATGSTRTWTGAPASPGRPAARWRLARRLAQAVRSGRDSAVPAEGARHLHHRRGRGRPLRAPSCRRPEQRIFDWLDKTLGMV